jgi:hypothetical protein
MGPRTKGRRGMGGDREIERRKNGIRIEEQWGGKNEAQEESKQIEAQEESIWRNEGNIDDEFKDGRKGAMLEGACKVFFRRTKKKRAKRTTGEREDESEDGILKGREDRVSGGRTEYRTGEQNNTRTRGQKNVRTDGQTDGRKTEGGKRKEGKGRGIPVRFIFADFRAHIIRCAHNRLRLLAATKDGKEGRKKRREEEG